MRYFAIVIKINNSNISTKTAIKPLKTNLVQGLCSWL